MSVASALNEWITIGMLIFPASYAIVFTFAGGCGFPRERTLRVPSHVRPDHQARNRRLILHRQQEMQRGGVHGGWPLLVCRKGTNVHGTTSGDGVKCQSYRWYPRNVLPFPAATLSTAGGWSIFMSCLLVTGRRYTPHICRNAIPHVFTMVSRRWANPQATLI